MVAAILTYSAAYAYNGNKCQYNSSFFIIFIYYIINFLFNVLNVKIPRSLKPI